MAAEGGLWMDANKLGVNSKPANVLQESRPSEDALHDRDSAGQRIDLTCSGENEFRGVGPWIVPL